MSESMTIMGFHCEGVFLPVKFKKGYVDKKNVTRASSDIGASHKWVRFLFSVNYPFKFCAYVISNENLPADSSLSAESGSSITDKKALHFIIFLFFYCFMTSFCASNVLVT